ncbi:WxcM-like domain-containing protein [Phytoactinopolyspora halotolerans]|uniref:Sugar 3,4-ketoisomerase QdtA cupin domain-containing protein n=1 Tax=Phytoactinopolyspora halotolerans TaxID=1981512 RepID=A0A6L9S373_9ACTN|nr:WxcM-like domain-containing protein [Phytoactinopolyspora halotolerans]NED99854.1 hypothetical protein [Phytoactinopolyspora halotolerans]
MRAEPTWHRPTSIHPTASVGADVRIGRGARVGAHAVVAPGVRIGPEALVAPSAVVEWDVPALAVVHGSPARVRSYRHDRYVDPASPLCERHGVGVALGGAATPGWVRRLAQVGQARGTLTHAHVGAGLPFTVRRVMVVRDVPAGGHRGDHGHRTLHELLICVAGSCDVLLDDGLGCRVVVHLADPSVTAYVAPAVWTAQFNHSPDAVLVILASAPYDPGDYIDDYDAFVAFARTTTSS